MIWILLEWLGVFLAFAGSIILGNKLIRAQLGWICWLLSNFCFLSLFGFHSYQYGLLFMQLCSLTVNILGLWQWRSQKELSCQPFLIALSVSGLLAALALIPVMIYNPSLIWIEWMGALLSISAAFLLASKHDLYDFCWVIWELSNVLVLSIAISRQQWGLACLQLGFIAANGYACYLWLYRDKSIYIRAKIYFQSLLNRVK